MSLADIDAGTLEVIQRQAVEGHLGGQHDLFVVVTIVATHLVIDRQAAQGGEDFQVVDVRRVFAHHHRAVRRPPGCLAGGQVALGPQQLALLQVVQQVLVVPGVVAFEQGQGLVGIAGAQLLVGQLHFVVVVAVDRATAQQVAEQQGGEQAPNHGF